MHQEGISWCFPTWLSTTAWLGFAPVRATPGTLQAGLTPFPQTHWSVVLACAGGEAEETRRGEAALAWLCHAYWPPLYSFVRRRGYSPADAQDLVQGFFAFLLESRAYTRVDRRHGKFRSFLLASLRNYLADARDRAGRLKRGGGVELLALDAKTLDNAERLLAAEASGAGPVPDEERAFERRWALAVVGRALEELEREFVGDGPARTRVFRELRPFLTGGGELPGQGEVAARLEVSPEALRNTLSRLRARYREALRAEVARTLLPQDDVETELRYLCRVLLLAA